jgi:hypothetical protein
MFIIAQFNLSFSISILLVNVTRLTNFHSWIIGEGGLKEDTGNPSWWQNFAFGPNIKT